MGAVVTIKRGHLHPADRYLSLKIPSVALFFQKKMILTGFTTKKVDIKSECLCKYKIILYFVRL
jgi:hypothetical protein